jgi:sulfane dehydrogenase subunit SoxC
VLQSRASDDKGNVQPTRAEFVAHRGELKAPVSPMAFPNQHFNAITSWAIDVRGEVKHAYA